MSMPQKKILVADDDADIQNLLKIILETNGYLVSLAANVVEAVQKAENELPDLILLDVVMPGKSGWEACKLLKSQDKTKHIPIVIFTALSATVGDKATVKYVEEAGANGYIPKPFKTEELLSEVKKHLEHEGR